MGSEMCIRDRVNGAIISPGVDLKGVSLGAVGGAVEIGGEGELISLLAAVVGTVGVDLRVGEFARAESEVSGSFWAG